MSAKPVYSVVTSSSARARVVQDEWGFFDPDKAGMNSVFRAVHASVAQAPPAALTPVRGHEPQPQVQTGPDRQAPAGVSPDSSAAKYVWVGAPSAAKAASSDEDVYDLSEPEPPRRSADRGAVYSLEFATRCPQCRAEIATVRVSRLLRTQVSFTSTLPRKGYIIVCPECEGILSAELSGLL